MNVKVIVFSGSYDFDFADLSDFCDRLKVEYYSSEVKMVRFFF